MQSPEETNDMESIYRIDREAKLVLIRQNGQLDLEVAAKTFVDIAADKDFSKGFDLFVDMTGVAQSNVSYNTISADRQRVTAMLSPLCSSRIAACLGSLDEFAKSRQWQAILGDVLLGARAFTDMAEAKAWLGLADDYDIGLED
jgi:hypothetical protein